MASPQEILAKLNATEKELSKALLLDYDRFSSIILSDDFAELLSLGLEQEALDWLLENSKKEDKNFSAALTLAFVASGTFFASYFAIPSHFDVLNPTINAYYGNYKLALLDTLRVGYIDTAGRVMFSGHAENWNAKELQMWLSKTIGLTPKQWESVQNYKKLLETKSLEALKRKLRDGTEDAVVREAFQGKGLSQKQIDDLVDKYIIAFKKFRAKTIGETESTRTYALAQHALVGQLIDDGEVEEGQIKRFWINMRDEKVRYSHKETPYMNKDGRRFDEKFETPLGPLLYPGDPSGLAKNVCRCRCVLEYKVLDKPTE